MCRWKNEMKDKEMEKGGSFEERATSAIEFSHYTFGTVDGFAGESAECGHEFVRVLVKVKKKDAIRMENCAVVRMHW